MKVELLYFDGCPSYQRLLPRLRALVDELAPAAEASLRRVESAEDAERERFLGSPSVRVNGVDVDPGAAGREDFGFECRLYRWDGATSPLPREEWIREALSGGSR
ncbi:MAG: hypothetical protein WBV53_01160 [Solirubrobacterales bacterium]